MDNQLNIDSPDLSPILLPYQQRWVDDESPLKVWLAARQTGKSFAVAMEAVIEGLTSGTGRCDNLILSASERQSKEVMQKVYMHLRYFKMRSLKVIRAERETMEEVTLPNGSRIISLPASPDTVRGFSGNVFLDEFAFHTDSKEIWQAMYPTVTRGYKVRVTSTPNGKQNMFHEIWEHNENFSKHRTDIHEACGDGLKVNIDALREGIADPDAWAQEFECRFLDEATAYITYEMITACEADTVRCDLDVEALSANAELFLGVDIGRKHDLTVFWLIEKIGDVLWTRMVKEMHREPFRIQRDFLYSILDGSYFSLLRIANSELRLRRCCIDSSGLGAQLAEEAREKFGQRVEEITFTGAVKEDLAVTLRRRFEDRLLRLPRNRDIREDIHSVKKLTTSAGNVRFDAGHSGVGHADRFWALALSVHAAGAGPAQVRYEPVMQREFGLKECF